MVLHFSKTIEAAFNRKTLCTKKLLMVLDHKNKTLQFTQVQHQLWVLIAFWYRKISKRALNY